MYFFLAQGQGQGHCNNFNILVINNTFFPTKLQFSVLNVTSLSVNYTLCPANQRESTPPETGMRLWRFWGTSDCEWVLLKLLDESGSIL